MTDTTKGLNASVDHGSKMKILVDKVQERVSKYDKNAVVDPYKGKGELGFFDLTMRLANIKDKLLLALTIIAIVFYGAAQPLFSYLFG